MQLHSLTVSGLRCFRNPLTLTDFDKSTNIVFGPNELGKSTLVWGLILAFCNRHDVGGEGILAYRPWGTDLSPVVEVEFTTAGKRYRLEKGFLDQAKCVLSEQAGGNYLRLADGKKADERVREFMLARFPGRGLARGSDLGLAHLLWMPQDKERFTSPSVSRQVEDHFRQAAGATIFTARDDKLLQLIDSRYAAVFTPKTADVQRRSELYQAQVRKGELEVQLRTAHEKLDAISAKVNELEIKERRAQDSKDMIEQLTTKLNRLSETVGEVEKIRALITAGEAEEKAAIERWRSIKQDWDHVEGWDRKGKDAASAIRQKEEELGSLKPLVQKLQEQLTAREADVTELTQKLRQANRELTRVYKVKQSLTLLAQIDKIREDCIAARQIQREIGSFETELSLKPLPTAKQLQEAEQVQRQIEISQGQAKAQGLRVDFRPVKEFEITVKTHEGKEVHCVDPDHPLAVDATGATIELEIAAVGTFSIQSGASELKGILSRLKAAKEKLAVILDTYKTCSVTKLRGTYDWGQNQRQQIRNLQAKLADILGEHRSIEALIQAGVALKGRLDQQCRELGIDISGLRSVSLTDTAELEQQTKDLEERQEKVQEELDALRGEHKEKESRQRTLEQALNEQQRLLQTAAEEQKKVLVNYQGKKDELERSLRGAQSEKEQQTYVLSQLREKLSPDADSLERTALRLKQEIGLKEQEALRLREEVAGLRAEINLQSEEGLYSKISRLEEEYELVQEEHRRLEGRAQAVKLLHRLVHARHETMLADITDPIRQGLNGLFQQVTFRDDRNLQLDADLSLAGLRVGSEESLQPLESFSIGTQEQMLLLARLSLAHFLSTGERQLVVLDDALVNSDGGRRNRILNLLTEAAAKRLQIVILTCHPEMYRELSGKRYDLASLM